MNETPRPVSGSEDPPALGADSSVPMPEGNGAPDQPPEVTPEEDAHATAGKANDAAIDAELPPPIQPVTSESPSESEALASAILPPPAPPRPLPRPPVRIPFDDNSWVSASPEGSARSGDSFLRWLLTGGWAAWMSGAFFALLAWIFRAPDTRSSPKYRMGEVAARVRDRYLLSPRAWLRLLLFCAFGFMFWCNAIHYWVETIDDAYITFRYSDNLINGRGLVYNVGERVEGFTNFTWMLAIAACIGAGWDAMFCSKVMGFLCCLGAMWGVAHWGALLSRRRDAWNWIVTLPMALNVYFACWSMMGLETQMAVVLTVWAFARFYQEMRDPRAWNLSPLLASLAAMTRFESLFYMTPMAAWAAVQVARGCLDWRRFLRWGLWAALFFGIYYIWKYWYFGDLLPNTYYAKVHGDYRLRGVFHLREWYVNHGFGFLNLCLVSFVICLLWPRPATLLVLGPIILNVYYVYHVNGDWMQNFRFFQTVIPFWSLTFLLAIRAVQRRLPLWAGRGASQSGNSTGDSDSLRPPTGRYGLLWLAVEMAVFGAWFYLVFFRGREILTGTKTGPVNLLWMGAVAGSGLLLIMRWLTAFLGPNGFFAGAQEPAPSGLHENSAPTPVSPTAPSVPRFWTRWARPAALELLAFGLLFALLWSTRPALTKLAAAFLDQAGAVLRDLGAQSVLASFDPKAFALPMTGIVCSLLALLCLGWIVRLVSSERGARSMLRWPAYAAFFYAVFLSAQAMLPIGTNFVWGADPFKINRAPYWARWSHLQNARTGGFSQALPQVAVWMLRNCLPGTTMFMSDIGYPMWLNMDMNLIDPDGLVTKEMADAPSVRGTLKGQKLYHEELLAKWRETQPLTPDDLRLLNAELEKQIAHGIDKKQPAPDQSALLEEIRIEYRRKRLPPPEVDSQLRTQAYNQHRADVNQRNLKWLHEIKPEYSTMFISHSTDRPDSPGFAYPEICNLFLISDGFKRDYVEMDKFVKYGRSWNHFYRRQEVKEGVTPTEQLRRLREAIRRNPRSSHLYTEILRAMREAEPAYTDEMKNIIRNGARLFRGNQYFLNDLAEIARRANDLDTAIEIWNRSLLANPDQEWLYRHLSDQLAAKGRLDEAIRITEQGIEKTKKTAWGYYNLSSLYERSKNLEKAVSALRKAAELSDPKDSRPYEDLAGLYDRMGQKKKALEAFAKAYEINPTRSHLPEVIRQLEEQIQQQGETQPSTAP